MKESNAYILGTERQELYRLGLQHQVWTSEAQHGWSLADFSAGQTLLDLGCGPGFCTKELAFIAGQTGKVIGIDKSAQYINYLKEVATLHSLNIEGIHSDFNNMQLQPDSIDGMYCRWALAWLPNPEVILEKVKKALKTKGKMVIHEYYDWSTHQTEPRKNGLAKAIAAALKSFKDSDGEIDIGRKLPSILEAMDMEIINVRMMTKLARPKDIAWHWPKSFYETYFPKLVEYNYLNEQEVAIALREMNELEQLKEATLFCPSMVEVIAEKK